ncbi:MAG: gluconokinase [Pyrinomonadaceae bacterium]
MVIVICGVAAAGKTTVGRALAARLGWAFYDADDLHSPENVEKMRSGRPLNDDDRGPWLARLGDLIAEQFKSGSNAVLACSALKSDYREALRRGDPSVRFVMLDIDRAEAAERIADREGHFMNPKLLASQFAILEPVEPPDLTADASLGVDRIVAAIVDWMDGDPRAK